MRVKMKVTVRGNNIEGALRLFRRKVTDSGTLFQYKEKMYHEKDTTKRQRKTAAAKNREKKRQGSTNAPPKLF
jgi:ribosomal protein S21